MLVLRSDVTLTEKSTQFASHGSCLQVCGIAGYHGARVAVSEETLRSMIDAVAHRGPDGRQVSLHGNIGLGSARLSLLDLSNGEQPMQDGDVALVFNGEIYNHAALRSELQQEGVSFSGRSDTEVLLRGFRRWGPALFDRLEGMYAVAIRDGEALHLARDPFGMKPLFYWISPGADAFVFASEIKAVLRCPLVPRRLDASGLVEHLVFGHTFGSRTLIGEVRQVAPGAHLAVTRQGGPLAIATTPPPEPRAEPRPAGVDQAIDRLTELLRESVARHVYSDHPVATYLSGGLDSSVVAALRPDHGSRSFVVADGKDVADLRHARRVATALELDHADIMITRAPPVDWIADAVLAMEAPFPPSVALVSAPHVRRAGKAVICGEGADELFAGYPVHEQPEAYLRALEERLLKLKTSGLTGAALATTTTHLGSTSVRDAEARSRAVYELLLRESLPNKHLAIWDRCAMLASLEVRMPYLDRGVRDFALSLPREWLSPRKSLIAAVARRVLPPVVADEITARAKHAAPDALLTTRHRLRGLAAAIMPTAWSRRHPLLCLSSSPHILVMLDLFLLAFVVGDGRFPAGMNLQTMYERHERELRTAHQMACEALFGAS